MQDYGMVQTDLIYPPGTQAGDVQCLGLTLFDNNVPEESRFFRVSIVSFTQFVRIFKGLDTTIVTIEDDDGKRPELVSGMWFRALSIMLYGNNNIYMYIYIRTFFIIFANILGKYIVCVNFLLSCVIFWVG